MAAKPTSAQRFRGNEGEEGRKKKKKKKKRDGDDERGRDLRVLLSLQYVGLCIVICLWLP